MNTKRRKFLKILLATAGVTILGSLAGKQWLIPWSKKLISPVLSTNTSTGSLERPTIDTLIETTKTLLGDYAIGIDRYENYFRWRAENLKGYKSLYEQFTTTVNQIAQKLGESDFKNFDTVARLNILERAFDTRNPINQWEKLKIRLFSKNWLLFDQYIIQEIFTIFANTDVWLVVGYEAWPDQPRGLERYQLNPKERPPQQKYHSEILSKLMNDVEK